MDKFDDLARRLRARVEQSASRERSLDWKAADTLEQLQARVEALEAENGRLSTDNRTLRREIRGAGIDVGGLHKIAHPERIEPQVKPPGDGRALGLNEAAQLLSVSYGTVYAHRLELGFFQVGSIWRVWPETLREYTERKISPIPAEAVEKDLGVRLPKLSGSPPFSPSRFARKAEVELDKLLAQVPRRRKRPTKD